MEQQKEPGLVPALVVIDALLVVTLLATFYYRSVKAQKARGRETITSLVRQRQVEGVNHQEQAVIKRAPPLKLLHS